MEDRLLLFNTHKILSLVYIPYMIMDVLTVHRKEFYWLFSAVLTASEGEKMTGIPKMTSALLTYHKTLHLTVTIIIL